MKVSFAIDAMRELCDQQVRFPPREKKLEQIANAKKLYYEIELHKEYPFNGISQRITDFKPKERGPGRLAGSVVKRDILAFIAKLSYSTEILPEELKLLNVLHDLKELGKLAVTADDMLNRFQVTKRTLSRWQRDLLPSQYALIDGVKQP